MHYDAVMLKDCIYQCETSSPEETKCLAALLANVLHAGDTVVLRGDLGAGKTQFVQGLAAGLGICDPVTSPTFTLLMIYEGEKVPLYHFDLYRLDDESELEDIGFYEMAGGNGVTCIEWGEKFIDELPASYVDVSLTVNKHALRTIQVSASDDLSAALVEVWVGKLREDFHQGKPCTTSTSFAGAGHEK